MIQTLLISGVLLAVGMALLLVKVLGRKDGKFSSQHIHDSQAMRERGIHCVMSESTSTKAIFKPPTFSAPAAWGFSSILGLALLHETITAAKASAPNKYFFIPCSFI